MVLCLPFSLGGGSAWRLLLFCDISEQSGKAGAVATLPTEV